MFKTVSVLVAVCAVASPVFGKGHPRSRSASPLLSSPLPEDEFPPLGPPITPPGHPGHPGSPRGPHSPPGTFSYPPSSRPEEFPPLGSGNGSPPVAPHGAWTNFPGVRPTSTITRPDSPPPVPPRRRGPSHPQSHPPRSPSPSSDGGGSYGHLILSLQWQGGVCADGKSGDRPCIRESKRNHWTIHGLWPSNDFDSPTYCSTDEFDGRRLENVKGQLNQLWPSYTATQDRYFTFWRHQWQKHGTCAGDVPQLRGLNNFFENTLKLAKQHDIKKYLENSNVKPSKQQTYQPSQIMKAISDDFPYKFDVVCTEFQNKSVLSEVRFCFDKALKPTNCRGRAIRCGNQVYYLPTQ